MIQDISAGVSAEALKKREQRARERDLRIPHKPNYERREKLERDTRDWLDYYIPEGFNKHWSPTKSRMVSTIDFIIENGGNKCIAGYRKSGKTSIAVGAMLCNIFKGRVPYGVIVKETGPKATEIVDDVRELCETQERLYEDYPEIVFPIRALERITVRAMGQTINGEHTRINWSGNKIRFPTVKGSRASGSIFESRGVQMGLRGAKQGYQRPSLILLDDLDEDGETDDNTRKKMEKIRTEIAYLGGETKLSIVMLCNTPKVFSMGYEFSDPRKEQSWAGERLKFIVKFGNNLKMWDKYVEDRRQEMMEIALSEDPNRLPRKTDQFYLDNREEMDDGFEVDDPKHYYDQIASDGEQLEFSTIQHYYNRIASDNDDISVQRELQMNPLAKMKADPESEYMDWTWFQKRSGKTPRQCVPEDTKKLIFTTDCNKFELHWGIEAWNGKAQSTIIEYGIQKTGATTESTKRAVQTHLLEALVKLYQEIEDTAYMCGNARFPVSAYGIDCGWLTDVIFQFKSIVKDPRVHAIMGTADRYTPTEMRRLPPKESDNVTMGHFWALRPRPRNPRQKIMHIESNYYKRLERQFFAIENDEPGRRQFFMTDNQEFGKHLEISQHYASVQWDAGKQLYVDGKRNHWSDRGYYALALANKLGIKLINEMSAPQQAAPRIRRYSLADKMRRRK